MPSVKVSTRLIFLSTISLLSLALAFSASAAPAASGPACTLPGVTVFTDPAGDSVGGLAAHDILSASIAEPAELTDQIVFTLKVADLSTLTPNTEWKLVFSIYDQRYINRVVAMNTFNPARGPVFTYGHEECGVSFCNVYIDGEADAGEYLPDGTIRITVARSKIGDMPVGQTFGSYIAVVQTFYNPSVATIADMDNHFGGTVYTVAGNEACRQVVAPPAAPANLTAVSPNNSGAKKSQVTLIWDDNADDEQVYHIERSTDASGGFVEIGTAAADATTYQDQAVESRTTYFYRVRASNAGGYSDYSNTAAVTVK